MLDDLKMIHERDAQDALGVAGKQGQQLLQEYELDFMPRSEIRNIVLAGMGGSAFFGAFVQSFPGLSLPFETVRNYSLPPYVDEHTLVISSSYSGNTEEALSALDDAEKRGAQIVVVAAGGVLLERAKTSSHPHMIIPGGIQPRMSSFYFISALFRLFSSLQIIDESAVAQLRETGEWLQARTESWKADVPTTQNLAKQIALELMGKTVIMYSGPLLAPAAQKWKICFNENAKNLAWWNQYPEFNHNEFIGWSSHPTNKPFGVVEIRSNLEHPQIQKRFSVTERLLSGKRPAPLVVTPEGETIAQQLFWSSTLGDHVSIYLALLNGVNPTPVDLVETFKAELAKS